MSKRKFKTWGRDFCDECGVRLPFGEKDTCSRCRKERARQIARLLGRKP